MAIQRQIGGLDITIEFDQRISEQLSEVSLNSAIQVRVGTSNAFMVTASTILPLIEMFDMGGVYISASRGAVEIIEALEGIGMSTERIHFIDLVSSGLLGGTETPYTNITFIDFDLDGWLDVVLGPGSHPLQLSAYSTNKLIVEYQVNCRF